MPELDSRVLSEVEYERGHLAVTFASGRRYRYSDVPRASYEALLAASSKGAFFNESIRDHYDYVEITARPSRAR